MVTSSKTQETTNFENSKTETVTVREPGTLTQIRVAVLVDGVRTLDGEGNTTGYEERSADEIAQLRDLVLTAIPYDEDRGDLVTVASMRFVDPSPFGSSEAAFSLFGLNKNDLLEIVTQGGIFIVIILLILMVVRPLIMRIIEAIPDAPPPPDPSQLEDRTRETPAIVGPSAGGGITPELMALAASGNEDAALAIRLARESGQLSSDGLRTDAKIDVAQVEGRIQESAIKKVADIIKANPDESVAIVRTWLYAD